MLIGLITMTTLARKFLLPTNTTPRHYEALRAYFVEGASTSEVARRFGYSPGSFKTLCVALRKNPDRAFFLPDRRGAPKDASKIDRNKRIVTLRKQQNLSAHEIARWLTREGDPISETAVQRILKAEGLPKLWRRTAEERRSAVRLQRAAIAGHRALDLSPRKLHTDFGGLFLIAHDLARIGIDQMLHQMPGSRQIPARCAFRALLALKLWGIGRPSHLSADVLDEGLAARGAGSGGVNWGRRTCRVYGADRAGKVDGSVWRFQLTCEVRAAA